MKSYLTKALLVALSSGQGKMGKTWYKAVFKKRLPDGSPVVSEFWLPEHVGEKMKKYGLLEDCNVLIACGFDNFFRFQILDVLPEDDDNTNEVIDLD